MDQPAPSFLLSEEVSGHLGEAVVRLLAEGASFDDVVATLLGCCEAIVRAGHVTPATYSGLLDQRAATFRSEN